jgi:hypothetical protein
LYTNTPLEIKSLGFGISCLEKYKDFEVGVNYNYAEFNFDQSQDPSFDLIRLNTEQKLLWKRKLFKNFGFNVSGRYNTSYLWHLQWLTV